MSPRHPPELCDVDAATVGHYKFIIICSIFLLLHILLLTHSFYHEYIRRNSKRFAKVKVMRWMYIGMQGIALIWIIIYMLVFGIDPHTPVIRNTFLCDLSAYSLCYIPGIFYGIYLFQLVLRLEVSFQGSYLAPPIYVLRTLKGLAVFISVLSTIFLAADDPHLTCLRSWDAPDLHSDQQIMTYGVARRVHIHLTMNIYGVVQKVHINFMMWLFSITLCKM